MYKKNKNVRIRKILVNNLKKANVRLNVISLFIFKKKSAIYIVCSNSVEMGFV